MTALNEFVVVSVANSAAKFSEGAELIERVRQLRCTRSSCMCRLWQPCCAVRNTSMTTLITTVCNGAGLNGSSVSRDPAEPVMNAN